MIDKQKAISALEANNYNGLSASVVAECIKVIRELPEDDGWIPVGERLPEEHEDETAPMGFRHYKESDLVIVAVVNDSGERFVSDDIRIDGEWNNYKFPMFDVTHWMPLPNPPKEGKRWNG